MIANYDRAANDKRVIQQNLAAGYAAMAADKVREAEAELWISGLAAEHATEPLKE